MDGMQLRLCFVTSFLSWTLLRFCVSESLEGKVLDLNTNLILLGKWPRSSPAVRRAFFACFSLFFFCHIACLQRSIVQLKIVGTGSFLIASWRSLKEGLNKLLTSRFCLKLSSVRCSHKRANASKARGILLLIFMGLETAIFWFWMIFLWSSLWTWNEKSFTFPAILELTNSEVTSFISDNYPTIFPTALRLWRIKNSDFNIPLSPQWFVQFV